MLAATRSPSPSISARVPPADALREETASSERLYDGRVLRLRRDSVRLPDGRTAQREVVEHPGSVVILALEAGGMIPFVRQWRTPAERALLELPAGTLDAGEDPQVAAARELEEEVGLRPGRLERMHRFWISPGWATEYMHGYLARDCTRVPARPDEDELLFVERYTLEESMQLVREGEVEDAKSLLMLHALALRAIGSRGVRTIEHYRGD